MTAEATMDGSYWVELVGDVIVARIRGQPTPEILERCQGAVVMLLRDTQRSKILYDALEMLDPTADIALMQRSLDASSLGARPVRRAAVVPNSRVAYLARLAFGDGEHRVFYNDLAAALGWLNGE
ncbi:MAG TPA: hypothetical protein VKA84_25355 [Gemmatimonadaceae bacterium]|nr:hypothetical protein [Gemmatimonadaceae bacterium]